MIDWILDATIYWPNWAWYTALVVLHLVAVLLGFAAYGWVS